jgi:hypothetical protein
MTCSEVQRVLPEFLDESPEGAFPTALAGSAFADHMKSCQACSDLVSDLNLIASEARQLAACEEPPQRVWVQIAAQLRDEGIIHEPDSDQVGRPVLVPSGIRRNAWSTWWLAPIAACLVVAGAYVISHKPAPQVAMQTQPVTVAAPPAAATTATPTPDASSTLASAKNTLPKTAVPQAPAQKSALPAQGVESAANADMDLEPSADDQQFLSVVSTRAPSLRATYESQLQTVNADIREVQLYLARNPSDTDARQELMDAYQKKALLYQIALDRIQ